jgi:2-(3-amino-3-carboxypropyl)histidine synthase
MQDVVKRLKKAGARRVFVQFGEGLKLKVQDIVKRLENNGFECLICLEKTFGACDIRVEEAKRLGCNSILHIGHSDFGVKTDIPVVYWEYFLDVDPCPIIEKEFDKLENFKKIGLVTNVQFVNSLQKAKRYLESRGKQVFLHKALQYPGQILGCKLDAAKKIEKDVDCFLCISAGKFYGLGLTLETEKPVLSLDLERRTIEDLKTEKERVKKLEAWSKAELKEAKKVGILISWKLGQLALPIELKRKIEGMGKEVYLLATDEITPEKLEGLSLDVLINCACPRIATDDLRLYKIPVLNIKDI